ncbi:MAG: hypothetical protein QGG87_00950, partial [Nitrospinota bacterium]|nr:hypothetical protein [Nitrospinota bacterium]
MIIEAISKIVDGNDLSKDEMIGVMTEIFRGEAT